MSAADIFIGLDQGLAQIRLKEGRRAEGGTGVQRSRCPIQAVPIQGNGASRTRVESLSEGEGAELRPSQRATAQAAARIQGASSAPGLTKWEGYLGQGLDKCRMVTMFLSTDFGISSLAAITEQV